jgi:hypothetical protein
MGWEGPLTARQAQVWSAWFSRQMNQPDRTDHYLMQIALVVARSNSKRPRSIKMKDFELEFREKDRPKKKSAAQRQIEMQYSKAMWAARLGTTVGPRSPVTGEYEVDEPVIVMDDKAGE